MIGIFQDYVKVYNRAPLDLSVTFDGQQHTIPSGHHTLPRITVPYAKNQNPVMGSQDPNNPHISGARYLVVEEGEEGYGVPMFDDEWADHLNRPMRMNERIMFAERYGNDPKARMVVQGKRGTTVATSRYEAGGAPGGISSFEGER